MKIAVVSSTTIPATLPDDPLRFTTYGSEVENAVLVEGLARAGHEIEWYSPIGSTTFHENPRIHYHPIVNSKGQHLQNELLENVSYDGSKTTDILDCDFLLDMSKQAHVSEELELYDGFKKSVQYRSGYQDWSYPMRIAPRFVTHCEAFRQNFLKNGFQADVARFGLSDFWAQLDDAFTDPWSEDFGIKNKEYFLFPHRPVPDKGIDTVLKLARAFPDETFVISTAAIFTDHIAEMARIKGECVNIPNIKFIDIPKNRRYHYGRRALLRNARAVLSLFSSTSGYLDSVASNSLLYWKEVDILKFGTIEELFLSYNKSSNKEKYAVLSVCRRPGIKPFSRPRNPTARNCDIIFANIKGVVYHGVRPVWRVTLHNGKSIDVTADHSLFCANNYTVRFEAKITSELEGGIVSIDEYRIDGQINEKLDPDLVTFMGLWMADGSYNRDLNQRVTGVNISTGNQEDIVNWLNKFIIKYPPQMNSVNKKLYCTRKGDVWCTRIKLAKIILEYFGNEVNSHTKRVPKFLFTAAEYQICAFLRGYFSGDGSIYRHKGKYIITCVSVSRDLLEDISILLYRLGIKNVIYSQTKKSKSSYLNSGSYYKLAIDYEHSKEIFNERIGLIKKYDYASSRRYKSKKILPISLRGIRKIEYIGPKDVYDISVPDTEAFVANGILCHNTGGLVSFEAIRCGTPVIATRSPSSFEMLGDLEDRGVCFVDGFDAARLAIKHNEAETRPSVDRNWMSIDSYVSDYEKIIRKHS